MGASKSPVRTCNMDIEKIIKRLRISIPVLSKTVGSYVPSVKTGNLVYTSGQLPFSDNRLIYPGRIGKDVSTEKAQFAIKQATINCLAAIKWTAGDFNKIKKIVRVTGYLCSAVGFNDQAKIMNSASDLLLEIFGNEVGQHSRVTVGCLELPMGSCVEVDMIVEV